MITSSLAPSSSLSRPYSSPDDHQTQPSTPAPIPLLSLLLRLEGNSSKYASIFDDHLLRSCVKRLLAGRTFLHSGYVDGHHASIRTSLSVKVPVTSLSSNRDKLLSLHFFVVDIQSKFKNNGNDPRFHVILPSTRIIFQKEVCDTVEDASLGNYTCELKPHQITTAPHQHLVETIRILINSFSRHRPTIPRVFLFSGPPGVGKTYAVKKAISIANSWTDCSTNGNAVHLISIRGSELMALSGGSAANAARELERQFEKAAKMCQSRKYNCKQGNFYAEAVVVFLDECDAFVSSHIVAAMLALIFDKMEGVVQSNTDSGHWEQIIVVGATNRVDAIPTFLRRPGRMEKEIFVSPPNANERFFLLETLLGDHKITQTELRCVAEDCVGFVAADLSALVRKAAMLGIERRLKEDAKMPEPSTQQQQRQQPGGLPATATLGRFPAALSITASDLHTAMIDTPASCLRDASLFAPPKTTWDDIAGEAGGAKTALRIAIEWPRTRKSAYNALGLSPPRGVLLHGPPGCGKTKLAKAAAGSAGVSFLSLSPAEVYSSSFVGDAEAV
jgi:SpoVK/Ycf46/Vps4 family AAA+-type ATPase